MLYLWGFIMYPKALCVMSVLVCGALCFATPVPVNGDLDIISTPDFVGVKFDQLPWGDIDSSKHVDIYPYVTDDFLYGYWHNLAAVTLKGQGYSVVDSGPASGDLALRIYNDTDARIVFAETVITLTFTDYQLDVYLPEFTLGRNRNIHFWTASDGSSYYVNYFEDRTGSPAMSAQDSIDAGHIARQAIPEPATIIILTAGALFTFRRPEYRMYTLDG